MSVSSLLSLSHSLFCAPMDLKKIHSLYVKRQSITQDDKLAMIKRHDNGEKLVTITRSSWMSQIISSTIVHNKDNILAYIKSEAPSMKKNIVNKKRGK